MGSVLPALDGNLPVAIGHRPRKVASLNRSIDTLEPTKFPGLVIVIQQLE